MMILQTLILALLAGGGVWWWQRRRRRRLATSSVADLSTLNLIGVTGVLDAYSEAKEECTVRLIDHQGREHVMSARIEDMEEPLRLGAELLVIQNPTPYDAMVVVPHELPRLEDLPR